MRGALSSFDVRTSLKFVPAKEFNRNRAPHRLKEGTPTKKESFYCNFQAHPNPSGNWSEWLLSSLYIPNPMAEEVPNKPLDYYTCPFKMSKLDRWGLTKSFFKLLA